MRFNIKDIVTKNWLVILLILSAAFLRLYKLPEFTTFLSDQGRDAIIVRDIVTFRHWPAIGAPSSVGQIYLGPFYYYLIAPFLLVFNFNPAGMGYGAAFLSLIGIVGAYWITRRELGKLPAVAILTLTAFSFENIEQSRFSWNPNLLPFFSFFTLYFFYQMIANKKWFYALLFGAFLSFSFQLHYLAAFLVLPALIIVLSNGLLISQFLNLLISFVSFLFFSSPLILFDFRHDFLNSRNFLTLFTGGSLVSQSSYAGRLADTVSAFFSAALTVPVYPLVAILILAAIPVVYLFLRGKKPHLWLLINVLNVLTYIFAFAFMNTARLPHYFGPIYLSFFLLVAYVLSNNRINKVIFALVLIMYIIINAPHYYFFYQKGGNQIAHSQTVADFLADKIGRQPYNLATWPVQFTEDNYVYFLELRGLTPADRKKMEITNQMFVLCNQAPCQVINSPSWNISMFGPAKIDKIWGVDGIKIYRLVHEK